jgi:hypothetical protein
MRAASGRGRTGGHPAKWMGIEMTEIYDSDLCVVMCYFNPDHYYTKRYNFEICRKGLVKQRVPHVIVECAFSGSEFELPHARNVLRYSANDVMWQKERLLNLGIQSFPQKYQKVAWIDCDILFEDDQWHRNASRALDTFSVIQLYDWSVRLPPGHLEYAGSGAVSRSFAYISSTEPPRNRIRYREHGRTGFAWAARRELLDAHGLYDACILGGADHLMAHAFALNLDSPCVTEHWTNAHVSHFLSWAQAIQPYINKGGLGFIEGRIFHLWHGEQSKRNYGARKSILELYAFEPLADLKIADSGPWVWSSTKTELHSWVRRYFSDRREDDSDSAATTNGYALPEGNVSQVGGPPVLHLPAKETTRPDPSFNDFAAEKRFVIYEWNAWSGFMLPILVPGAIQIKADPRDTLDAVLEKIPESALSFAFHLDCTYTKYFPFCRDSLLQELERRGLACLNAYVTDISKRHLHRVCERLGLPSTAASIDSVQASDRLLIKTNCNHFGLAEGRLCENDRELMGIGGRSPLEGLNEYQVLNREEIPTSWWEDPTLVVERFIANSAKIRYRCYFAGNHFVISTLASDQNIMRYRNSHCKGIICTNSTNLKEAVHADLPRSLQVSLGPFIRFMAADFGTVDVVLDDNEIAYIIDLNTTTYTKGELSPQVLTYLQRGLGARVVSLLEERSSSTGNSHQPR